MNDLPPQRHCLNNSFVLLFGTFRHQLPASVPFQELIQDFYSSNRLNSGNYFVIEFFVISRNTNLKFFFTYGEVFIPAFLRRIVDWFVFRTVRMSVSQNLKENYLDVSTLRFLFLKVGSNPLRNLKTKKNGRVRIIDLT